MEKEKIVRGLSYAILIFFILTFLTLAIKEIPFANSFFHSLEVKSLDIRENILVNFAGKQINDNSKIALIVIDDDSLEKLSDKYGYWPWNRKAYADVVKYLANDQADSIFLDFIFLGFQQGNESKDWEFINELKKHDNVYISMSFDFRQKEKSKELPLSWAANLDNKSNINFEDFNFTNLRPIMPEVVSATQKVGFVNFQRDNDGISRRAPSFFTYKEEYYPYMALQITQDYLLKHNLIKSKKYIITQDNHLLLDKKKIKLDKDGYLILNWHNKSNVEAIPFWQVINGEIEKGYFKDKIVAIGASAVSLADTKSTPIDKYMPGVKIITTYINNILNNNAIIPADTQVNLSLVFVFILISSILFFKLNSNALNVVSVILLISVYFAISLFALAKFNLWIDFAYPVLLILTTYTIVYMVKFLKKSQDFERTYKLATTDGLTELYNHRYFQEQMLALIDTAKRYNTNFSLIMVDIDYFKKFNDKFGHQVGDDVLKKIAGMLKKTVRASDIVARYGGEEMAVILPNTNLEDAITTANKICKTVSEKPFKLLGGIDCVVTISLGVATFPLHGNTPQELIETADRGLYYAKEHGRNQVGKVQSVQAPEENENRE